MIVNNNIAFKTYSDSRTGFWRFNCATSLYSCETLACGKAQLAHFPGWFNASRIGFITDAQLASQAWVKTLMGADNGQLFILSTPVDAEALQSTLVQLSYDKIDMIIAIGGGTVLDAAKLLATALAQNCEIQQLPQLTRAPDRPIPLIAIPTTFGTGSETNMISHLQTGDAKIGLRQPWLAPTIALLIAEIALHTPWELRYLGGVDAWLHALEAATLQYEYSPLQGSLLQQSLLLHHASFAQFLDQPDSHTASDLVTAATLSGIGLNNGRTGLIHALAGPYAQVTELPHALSLLPFIGVALDALVNTLEQRSQLPQLTAVSMKNHFEQTIALHIPRFKQQLSKQFSETDIKQLADQCLKDSVAIRESPLEISHAVCCQLYQKAFDALQ